MKTVSGKVVSTRPISLSKAAKVIARFTAMDNGATPAFAAYLRRTRAAFDELVHLHKECKPPYREPPVRNHPVSGDDVDKKPIAVKRIVPQVVDVDGVKIETGSTEVQNNLEEPKKRMKKSKVKEENAEPKNEIKEGNESCSIRNAEQRCETNAENKDKDKDGLVNEKKHKKRKSHDGENVRSIEAEAVDKKTNRKRKHENVVDGELDGSHDAARSKKKKKEIVV